MANDQDIPSTDCMSYVFLIFRGIMVMKIIQKESNTAMLSFLHFHIHLVLPVTKNTKVGM